jgi:hypothetical protein
MHSQNHHNNHWIYNKIFGGNQKASRKEKKRGKHGNKHK